MGLKKLVPEYIQRMKRDGYQNIYLVGFSENYLEELLMKNDIADYLSGVLSDTDNRMSGDIKRGSQKISFRGRELQVFPYSYFDEVAGHAIFIILNDYFLETYEKLAECSKTGLENAGNIYYFANRETEIDLHYREQYKNTPLEDLIVFRSGPHASSYVKGMDYADNARALFEYMLDQEYNRKYELVWLVKDPGEFLHMEQQYPNVHFLSFDWAVSEKEEERDVYYRALCLAKYIFMTDAYGFCRNARKDQIRVQLWHGCGFKTRINFDPCERRYEYNIVISEIYKKIHQEIYGLREDQVLVTGYPKDDQLFHPDIDWKNKLGIPEAECYIFWLPTFRTPVEQLSELNEKKPEGQTGLPIIQNEEELWELNQLLQEKKAVLIVKLHPFQNAERVCAGNLTNIVLLTNENLVLKDIQINQILGNADGLISDYSSAAIDFLLLDRPVAFTLDDVETYEKSRGFVFEPIREWLPGNEIYSFSDFIAFIEDVISGKDIAEEKRKQLTKKLHQFQDDQSSRRVLKALGIENERKGRF